jgi:hypothetical protein
MPRGLLGTLGNAEPAKRPAEAVDQPPAVPRCEACRRRRGIPSPVLEVATVSDVGQTWLCKNTVECRRFWS